MYHGRQKGVCVQNRAALCPLDLCAEWAPTSPCKASTLPTTSNPPPPRHTHTHILTHRQIPLQGMLSTCPSTPPPPHPAPQVAFQPQMSYLWCVAHCQIVPRFSKPSCRDAAGRAPGISMASARQLSSENLVAATLGGLDINAGNREPPLAPLGPPPPHCDSLPSAPRAH